MLQKSNILQQRKYVTICQYFPIRAVCYNGVILINKGSMLQQVHILQESMLQ